MTDDEREMVFALSGTLVVLYEPNGLRDSPIIDRIAQVAAMMNAHDWEVPPVVRDVLRKAAEADVRSKLDKAALRSNQVHDRYSFQRYPPNCLVAERSWDQVRWAIEANAWRFDRCAKPSLSRRS